MADGSAPPVPATEKRGGEHPDWAGARPGEELPELPAEDAAPAGVPARETGT
jgi:hypothetical protein